MGYTLPCSLSHPSCSSRGWLRIRRGSVFPCVDLIGGVRSDSHSGSYRRQHRWHKPGWRAILGYGAESKLFVNGIRVGREHPPRKQSRRVVAAKNCYTNSNRFSFIIRSARTWARSYCACCTSQLSALPPKTFESLTAI